jgi:EAL domain-containing protein (putative c-di-GMP-specific phosphodiesterase class I)/DNA-binding SARP family transcriptional activator
VAQGNITLLGRVAIAPVDGGPEVLVRGGRRVELVFAYLVAERRRQVSHDELANALWPEGPPDTWEAALRGVLTDVRRWLSDGGLEPAAALTTARRGNQLQLPPMMTVDLDVARESLASALGRLAAGEPRAAAEEAARAASLAALPFLPAHDGDWVESVRRELLTITSRALEAEARAHAATGDHTAASAAAERLVAAEPFNEGAHQFRIKMLVQAGDRAGALRAFEYCRALLDAELGVEPSDATKAALLSATESSSLPFADGPAVTDPFTKLSVLVVEDHDFQRRTAVMLLRKLGVGAVTEAADGAAALALLHDSAAPDVIVCDIDMPGMDGVEFIRHVAARELAGAVVIASALDTKVVQAVRSVSEGYGLQVLGAVAKPLTRRGLTELLATYRRPPRSEPLESADGRTGMSAADVRAGLADGRITVQAQPGVEVATGLVTCADAVPRWLRPGGAELPIAVLRSAVERAGQLADLSNRALEAAGRWLVGWAGDGMVVEVTVPLASDSVSDTTLADRAAATVHALGADPALITFALDERVVRNAPADALDVSTRLRVKGFNVALENFGSGHAPDEQLRRVPFTQARLPPLMVAGAAVHPERVDALETVAEAARILDVDLIGNGCESADDLRLLLDLGCSRVLGPFVAAPMPGEKLPVWSAAWHPTRLGLGDRE